MRARTWCRRCFTGCSNTGTINLGNITVENVTVELEINNMNRDITLTNIGGSAVAHTINGELKALFRQVDTNAPMAFSTLTAG